MSAEPVLRYAIFDPTGHLCGESETWDGARSCRVHDSNETGQDAGRYRIEEHRPHGDVHRVRVVNGEGV